MLIVSLVIETLEMIIICFAIRCMCIRVYLIDDHNQDTFYNCLNFPLYYQVDKEITKAREDQPKEEEKWTNNDCMKAW